jgi:hypothetical protein
MDSQTIWFAGLWEGKRFTLDNKTIDALDIRTKAGMPEWMKAKEQQRLERMLKPYRLVRFMLNEVPDFEELAKEGAEVITIEDNGIGVYRR